MAIDIKVPAAGESITSANIAKWYKNSGDFVKKGEALVSLETDKVSNELEAEADGILTITVGEGEEVSIGTVIGQLAPSGESSAPVAAPQAAAAPAPAPTAVPAPVAAGASVEIVVPAAGESITSANVAAWRKKDGDFCEKGEILVTLESQVIALRQAAEMNGHPEGEEDSPEEDWVPNHVNRLQNSKSKKGKDSPKKKNKANNKKHKNYMSTYATMCRFFAKGHCRYGDQCHFRHHL